jgi:hypothetical protein
MSVCNSCSVKKNSSGLLGKRPKSAKLTHSIVGLQCLCGSKNCSGLLGKRPKSAKELAAEEEAGKKKKKKRKTASAPAPVAVNTPDKTLDPNPRVRFSSALERMEMFYNTPHTWSSQCRP